uniref:Uncharacterized protein n=1 Tax=Magallana gigas TaxID=29159 RepID=K1PT93_MAGGI
MEQENNNKHTSTLECSGRTPGNMTDISIVPQILFQDKDEIYFEEDDVLQLQCIAEVENINGLPSKDIRWCKNESGKFQKLSLQHPPLTSIVSRSKDGCSVVQKSVIFYHILQNDTDVDLMCESGYSDKWRVSPIVIHDRESVLNKNLIKLNGAGKTIYLLCTASTLFQQESLQNKMNWCFKRQVNETWTKISPQEKKVEVVSNSSGETTIFSRIKYHVTVLDRDIFFLCEIYRYSRRKEIKFRGFVLRINREEKVSIDAAAKTKEANSLLPPPAPLTGAPAGLS